MKIYYLGTCSGTEPMADMHHTSYVIETNGSLYWFDAGENAAHRAYTSGMDILATRAVFISHSHVDHIGGLPNLLFCFEKLISRYGARLKNDNTLKLYLPDKDFSAAVKLIGLGKAAAAKGHLFTLDEKIVSDGVIYEDENVKVSAIHNTHLGEKDEAGWHSFSYLFEAEGKRIVCSGDVKNYSELDEFVLHGCDLLIAETGHHAVAYVVDYSLKNEVKALRFTHHGREILRDREEAEKKAYECSKSGMIDVKICFDGMTEEF